MSTSARNTALRVALYVLIVLLISNLGALVDRVLHPEIPYFDREHVIVGAVLAVAMILLLGGLEVYLARRRRVEAALRDGAQRDRTILQTAMDGFCVLDMDGRLLEVNEAYSRMSGYSADELLTMRISDLEDVESPAETAHHIETVAAQGAARFESRQRRKDGAVFDVEVNVHHVPIEGGRLVAFLRDVTRRRHDEAEIRRLNEELEERVLARTLQLEATNRELEAFVYSASHDLRAPLRAIDGFSHMVAVDAAERLEPDDVAHLQRVRGAAQRMGLLIDHLLALSRSSRQALLYERVDVSVLALSVFAELKEEQPQRAVETVVSPGLTAHADAVLVRVIVTNLLGNAWKFTSKKDAARIEVGAVESGGERAFFVRDDGAGFDMATAQHLFGAFQRFHAPDEFEGDGIGLATVQRLVARHGGRVWAEAEVGRGATFFFTLPGDAEAPA